MATINVHHQHLADRHAFRTIAGVLAVVVAAAMVMVFAVLVAQIVQNLLGVTVTPAVNRVRTMFWWVATNRDLPP